MRRAVSFSEAIYEKFWKVEDVPAQRADSAEEALTLINQQILPVLAQPELDSIKLNFTVLVDARLKKEPIPYTLTDSIRIIGLGPGFTAGENCHAAIETQRGHNLGRVYWQGATESDTRLPEGDPSRVLRAPASGLIKTFVEIGDFVKKNQLIAEVAGIEIVSPFDGVLRGLIRPKIIVEKDMKIGDVDPRGIRDYCFTVSDKALAVGGAVLEAILTKRQ